MLSCFSRVWLFETLGTVGLPGSSVHRILQARVLEWVDFPSSRGSSYPRTELVSLCLLHQQRWCRLGSPHHLYFVLSFKIWLCWVQSRLIIVSLSLFKYYPTVFCVHIIEKSDVSLTVFTFYMIFLLSLDNTKMFCYLWYFTVTLW